MTNRYRWAHTLFYQLHNCCYDTFDIIPLHPVKSFLIIWGSEFQYYSINNHWLLSQFIVMNLTKYILFATLILTLGFSCSGTEKVLNCLLRVDILVYFLKICNGFFRMLPLELNLIWRGDRSPIPTMLLAMVKDVRSGG